MNLVLQFGRLLAVLALLVAAAALATPPGRLPLALRGLARILRRDAGLRTDCPVRAVASRGRRLAAFLFVLLAAIAAVL